MMLKRIMLACALASLAACAHNTTTDATAAGGATAITPLDCSNLGGIERLHCNEDALAQRGATLDAGGGGPLGAGGTGATGAPMTVKR